MAITANTIWECRVTGASTNGGGFDSTIVNAGTDYSLQDSPQLSLTDVAIADGTTTTITSGSGGFTAGMIGNAIYLTGGSGGTLNSQRRLITAFTDGNTVTVDAAPAPTLAMTGVTAKIGGCLSGPWDATDIGNTTVISAVPGNVIYVKYGTYSRTASWNLKSGLSSGQLRTDIVSYDTNRTILNTDANRSLITTSTNTISLITGQGSGWPTVIRNFIFSSTAASRGTGLTNSVSSGSLAFYRCKFTGFSTAAQGSTSAASQVNAKFYFCEITGSTAGPAVYTGTNSGGWDFIGCYIHDNVGNGIEAASTVDANIVYCLIVNNSGDGVKSGGAGNTANFRMVNNTIANNAGSQIRYYNSTGANIGNPAYILNNIIWGGQYGIYTDSIWAPKIFHALRESNAIGGASVSNLVNIESWANDIILTANPFVNSTTQDYTLNLTSGGGAACRASGFPEILPGYTQTSYLDLGALQTQSSGGSAPQISYAFIN